MWASRVGASLTVSLVALSLTAISVPAHAAAQAGYRDFSYRDANAVQTPTEDKAQSKLWFQDGSWWALMYNTSVHSTDIFRLDAATQTWQDTGSVVDTRPTARGDALWDGAKLYVVSGTTVVSEYGSPPNPDDVSSGSAQLSRYSYSASTSTYSLDSGFPVTVHQGSAESITLAKDSTGELWVTYTAVAPDNSSTVYVNHSLANDASWASPTPLPTAAASVHYDDISAILFFQGDKIGVMWSNQLTRKFYFAVHQDGSPSDSWSTEVAYGGGVGGCSTGCANDHVNLKAVSTDGSGRVFAAVKTANRNTGQAFVVLLGRDRHAAWTSYPFGAVEDLHTRPMLMIDEESREIFMFAVSPEVGGTVYYKKTSLDNISFPSGVGTPVLQSDVDSDISNVTSTKQSVNARSGLVLLASANANGYYWHASMDLSNEPSPRPAAPSGLTVGSPATGADSSLSLRWSDNSSNESGFAIERKTGTSSYSEIARVAADSTVYTDTRLAAGSTYTYRVLAWNSVGSSAYSDEASGTTLQTGPVRVFSPVADSYVDSAVPNTNYGSKTLLSVDYSPIQESYLRFQTNGLTGNTVTSAKLRLYVTDNGSVKGGSVAKMSNNTWGESSVTYNNRPLIDGPTLSTLGAVNIGTWYEFDVTPAVQGDGTLSLGVKSPSTDGAHYGSREDSAHAPQLVVTVTQGDLVPPDTTIDGGPSGVVKSSAAQFSFSASEAGSTFECAIDGAAFAACASGKQYSGLAEGTHGFKVRAIDAVGNIDATPAVRTWTVDTVAPATIIDSGPSGTVGVATASFTFHADEDTVTFGCALDGAGFSPCTSPQQYAGLGEGPHTFTVRSTDAAGNIDAVPPSATWTVDTIAPDTTINSGPQGVATSDTADFTFSSGDTDSVFRCSLDGAAWAGCTSPTQYSGLSKGQHTFDVAAVDLAGNVDASPAERQWTVDLSVSDTTPPTVSVTAPDPDSRVRGTVGVSASASDDEAVDHVDFLVDGVVVATDGTAPYSAAWDSTSSPDGPVTITARAADTSSNHTTSAGVTVTVDNTAPDTVIDSGPQGPVASTSADVSFSSTEVGSSFECSLDAAAFATCTSPRSYAGLTQGSHVFKVRSVDQAGNTDSTPAQLLWTVDTVAPETTISSGPVGSTNSRSASFVFGSSESGSSFTCSLDGSSYGGCTSPKLYTGLSDGSHTFRVQASDAAGNVDPTPASQTWVVEPVVFSDGFESGNYSSWTSVHATIDGTATVQSSVVRSGAYSARLAAPSSTSYAYARKTLATSQSDLTVSGDFDVAVEGATGQEVPIFKLYDASGTRLVYVNRRNVSGRIYVNYNGTTYASTQKLALGTWARFAVHVVANGAGASTIEVKMNGTSIYQTGIASLTTGIRTIQIGNDKQLPFALYADDIDSRI